MVIQKITYPDITRNVTMEASEYFKCAIDGWVIVNDAGVLYYPPEEWQVKPEYVTIHILEDDWDTFHSLCLWKQGDRREGIIEGEQKIKGKDIHFIMDTPQ